MSRACSQFIITEGLAQLLNGFCFNRIMWTLIATHPLLIVGVKVEAY